MSSSQGRPISGRPFLSVYVHVPFCARKCPYCAFESAPIADGDDDAYLRELAREVGLRAGECGALNTLYFGGGTPSILSVRAWEKIVDLFEKNFSFAPDAEVTIEANPASISRDHVDLWRSWRARRVSLGVQSFDDRELSFLGRLHDSSRARASAEMVARSGVALSIDLIFGLPGAALRTWASSLRSALACGARHISVYGLTIEPGTPFASRDLDLPDGYAEYRFAQWYLPAHGLEQYEIANFAARGFESRHNLNYWANGTYLGLGRGAWSYDGASRTKNGSREVDSPNEESAAREAAVLALRTSRGIEWKNFSARYKKYSDAICRELAQLPADLVEMTDDRAKLTKRGMRLANVVWETIV